MNTVITVENLSKRYILSHQGQERYTALRDVMAESAKKMGKRILNVFSSERKPDQTHEEFWALKDVSFEVKQGERVGIIGRNGVGKSTLLKILSRITEPTIGRVKIKGRVASLLEVGTGFHTELTGRENIYLNGAILGMPKAEIKRKFDEIVAFAEVDKFLDTPVKRYSSGMYVRLAFAVAAHLEPEILIVDEVLAVGDAQFQKKCLGKMKEVGKEGRTVLFVSHNMAAIKSLCCQSILLEAGCIKYIGEAVEGVKMYESYGSHLTKNIPAAEIKRSKGLPLWAKMVGVSLINEDGENQPIIDSKKPFIIRITVLSDRDSAKNISVGIRIQDASQCLVWCHSIYEQKLYTLRRGINIIDCNFSPSFLVGGDYYLRCWIYSAIEQSTIDMLEDAYYFSIYELDPFNTGFPLKQPECVYDIPYSWQDMKN